MLYMHHAPSTVNYAGGSKTVGLNPAVRHPAAYGCSQLTAHSLRLLPALIPKVDKNPIFLYNSSLQDKLIAGASVDI